MYKQNSNINDPPLFLILAIKSKFQFNFFYTIHQGEVTNVL